MFKLIILCIVIASVRSEEWVAWDGDRHGLPHNAVQGGNELEGAYVIRANTHGALLPGKYAASMPNGFVSTNGEEIPVKHFEVLTARPDELTWEDENTNRQWVKGGRSARGEDLFICRFWHDGKLISGKFHYADQQRCHIGYAGKEHTSTQFGTLKFW